MEPEEVGNCVRLGTLLIPAVNIQAAETHFSFSIMFENGSRWNVLEYYNPRELSVIEFPQWVTRQGDVKGPYIELNDWEDFVSLYNEKRIMGGC